MHGSMKSDETGRGRRGETPSDSDGSAGEPMPFAIDLLAGIELLLCFAALGFVGLIELARRMEDTTLPQVEPLLPRLFREPGPTAVCLLAGPPVLVAIGLFRRKPWGRWGAIALHVSLGVCAIWHFALRFSAAKDHTSGAADVTIVMLFLLAMAIGVPLFLRRRHLRAAFARGRR